MTFRISQFTSNVSIYVLTLWLLPATTASPNEDGGPKARDILERVRASIAANRSAAKSVVITGHGEIKGNPVKDVPKPERAPFYRAFKFTYVADEFGRRKHWEATWTGAPDAADYNTHRVLAEDKKLSVSANGVGTIYTADDDLSGRFESLDFYRDHWPLDEATEGLDLILKNSFGKDANWTVKELMGGTVSMICQFRVGESETTTTIEVQPGWNYMVSKVITPGEIKSSVYKWDKDEGTQIWYPTAKSEKLRVRYPSGLVFQQESVINVDSVRFNESVPAETFTFQGLGLKPGSEVYDRRVNPPVGYIYQPSAESAQGLLDGLVPQGALEKQPQEPPRRRWLSRVVIVVLVLLAGSGLGYLYTRYSRRTAKAP
jgi:hypothetical protein